MINQAVIVNRIENIDHVLKKCYVENDYTDLYIVQDRLFDIHSSSFRTPSKVGVDYLDTRLEFETALKIEKHMLDYEDRYIDMGACPDGANGGLKFVQDLKEVIREHSSSKHQFYTDYLPNEASAQDIAFYLAQESELDPRFDDFIALMQIGLPINSKLELAHNYWDELGNGEKHRVHTVMFQQTLNEVGATENFIRENIIVPARVCGNLSALLALRRPLLYRAIGAFAVTEYLFPRRCSSLLEAWKREGLSDQGIAYHREHIGVDARHASGFFKNVIIPIIDKRPDLATEIYWGAVARLNSSGRYLDSLLFILKSRLQNIC